jgi:menaquinone-dependent protoporphyrinogen oxidase
VTHAVTSAPPLDGVDAVAVGGALYANKWHKAARRFVRRHRAELAGTFATGTGVAER